MSKDCYYFKHDSNARHDHKILAMRSKYGSAGYGNYWIIIEEMRESSNYKLEDKMIMWTSLSDQMKLSVEELKVFVNDCIENYELFGKEGEYIYSPALLKRMADLDLIRSKRSMAGKSRWDNE